MVPEVFMVCMKLFCFIICVLHIMILGDLNKRLTDEVLRMRDNSAVAMTTGAYRKLKSDS